MQYKKFLDTIVNFKDRRVRPFSPKFDATILGKVKKKALNGAVAEEDFETLYSTFVEVSKFMKLIYDDVYAAQKQIIEKTHTPAFDIISHLTALVNCNYCAVLQKLNQGLSKLKTNIQPYEVLTAAKLESFDKNVGLLPVDSSLEMQIDVLSMLLNYIRYFRDTEYELPPENGIEYVEAVKALFFNMSGLCALKTDYDDCILNDGFIKYDRDNATITFDYFSHGNLKLLRTGAIVLNQKVMHEYNKNLKKNLFSKYFSGKRIKNMTVADGKVSVKFSSGRNGYLEDKAKAFAGSITGYYDYLTDVRLPNFDNATVLEAISVWLALQALSDYIQVNFKWDFDVNSKEAFSKVPCRISKETLSNYVSTISSLSKTKIRNILNAFIVKPEGGFCDLWNEPLYDCGEYYILPLFSISQGISFNTIDVILEKGGVNLQDRGPVFEKFIYSEMSKPHQLGYKRDVYGSRKYERNDVDYQEIDCIIEMKNLVIVAELKCTQYPMNALNQHDCWKRLKQGCNQAIEKAQFVKDNPKVFGKLSTTIPGKTILPVVVTNYPNYTGFSHNGVYVIDAHAFTSYLNTGVVTANMVSKEQGNQIVGITHLYKNEDEFVSNIHGYLKENPLIGQIMTNIEIKEMVHPEIYGMKTRVIYASPEVDEAPVIQN